MSGNFFIYRPDAGQSKNDVMLFVMGKVNALISQGKTAFVNVAECEPKRTLSANSLYWQWMDHLSKYFTGKGKQVSKDDMHDLMRNRFLGWTNERMIGNTKINPTLKSTSKLNKGEMCQYMEQVSAWASNCGVMLPTPEHSEYMDMIARQNA